MFADLRRLALCGLAGLAVTGCTALPGSGGAAEGDYLRDDATTAYALHLPEGQVFTDGFTFLLVEPSRRGGDDEVVLEDVELVGGSGFEIYGALAAGDDREAGGVIQYVEEFPPTNPDLGTVTEVPGTTVPPNDMGLELLVGMRVTTAELAVREGVRVRYRVGDRTYQQTINSGCELP